MLIDDIEIQNFIVKRMIKKLSEDYEIYDYTYASKALDDINKVNPDIIFLDIDMPKINGWKFLQIMKENDLRNSVYILTSSTSELDVQKSKNYDNVKDFLIKPLNKDVLKNIFTSIYN